MAKQDATGGLFSAEEMTQAMSGSGLLDNGPVTCLGLEFENDEARRSYFREELRKKLPELRKIEGFPIGEDDDIINLSDPPYYTACPNPWLNMLINQWNEQKEKLVKEGKRKENFEVKEPYANDVTEGKNNPVYTHILIIRKFLILPLCVTSYITRNPVMWFLMVLLEQE